MQSKLYMDIKRLIIQLILLLFPFSAFAQHPGPRSFEVTGLPDGKEVMETLPAGLGYIALGIILIAIIVRRGNQNDNSMDSPVEKGLFGCGCLSLIIGVVYLVPLLTWIEYGFVSVVCIIAIISVVIIAINWIINQFKGK